MKIEVNIDPNCPEARLTITAPAMTEEIQHILSLLSESKAFLPILGNRDGIFEVLPPEAILRIYAADKRVFAVTPKGEYLLKLRLYSLEERLHSQHFIRISHSELINLSRAESFDLSLNGTIRVKLSDGSDAYVSRRYVTKIKKFLGL